MVSGAASYAGAGGVCGARGAAGRQRAQERRRAQRRGAAAGERDLLKVRDRQRAGQPLAQVGADWGREDWGGERKNTLYKRNYSCICACVFLRLRAFWGGGAESVI